MISFCVHEFDNCPFCGQLLQCFLFLNPRIVFNNLLNLLNLLKLTRCTNWRQAADYSLPGLSGRCISDVPPTANDTKLALKRYELVWPYMAGQAVGSESPPSDYFLRNYSQRCPRVFLFLSAAHARFCATS